MANAAILREQVKTALGSRWDAAFESTKQSQFETILSAVGEIPRGTLTEVSGAPSSGRTTFLYALLAAVTGGQEFCALIDAEDAFDPASAEAAGVQLSQVLWVRCGRNVEHALKAADLLSQAGGFGIVALDLADSPLRMTRRISLASWFRLRHGVENTRTAFVAIGQQIHASSCSTLKIELRRERVLWRGHPPAKLLHGVEVTARRTERHRAVESSLLILR